MYGQLCSDWLKRKYLKNLVELQEDMTNVLNFLSSQSCKHSHTATHLQSGPPAPHSCLGWCNYLMAQMCSRDSADWSWIHCFCLGEGMGKKSGRLTYWRLVSSPKSWHGIWVTKITHSFSLPCGGTAKATSHSMQTEPTSAFITDLPTMLTNIQCTHCSRTLTIQWYSLRFHF